MVRHLLLCVVLVSLLGCQEQSQQAFGTLEWDRINGRAMATEVISYIYVTEGAIVEAGTPLLRLDDRKIRAEMDSVKNQLKQSEWVLQELVAGPRPQTIAEEKARVAAATVTVTSAQLVYSRRKELFSTRQVSKEEFDRAKTEYLSAKATLQERQEALDELLAGTRAEQLEQARAQTGALAAQLLQLELQLADYTVTASRTGRVDSIPFKLGDRPPMNAVVVTLLSGDRPWARVYVPEPFRSSMVPGNKYTVLVDGQDAPYAAKLRTISSEASFTPYYALTEKDRSRLAYVAELDLVDEKATHLTAGTPVQLLLESP